MAQTTMPKDNMHHGGAEHRDIHNLYGTMYHEATAQGLIARGAAVHGKDGDRPFVLSRAFFAGTQVSAWSARWDGAAGLGMRDQLVLQQSPNGILIY